MDWVKYGKDHLEGRTITEVRYLTNKEAEQMGWYHRSIVMQLDNGTIIMPSRDDEGNDAGALFGFDPNEQKEEQHIVFPVIWKES